MDFFSILTRMAELFLIILVGYACCKLKIMDRDFNRRLTSLVLLVTSPCLTLSSVMTGERFTHAQIGSCILLSVLTYVLSGAAALLLPKLLRLPKGQGGVYRFMLLFGNVGFIGFPVIQAIFGTSAVFYASIFNMPFNLLSYTVGIVLITDGGSTRKLKRKDFCTPILIASVITLLLALFPVEVPELISGSLELIGNITTPAALLIIGSNLALLPLKGIWGGPRVWAVTVLRLLVLPVLVLLLLRGWVTDPTVLGVAVIIQGMPVATNTILLALQYDGDTVRAGQGIFVSTLFSILTIPILTLLL